MCVVHVPDISLDDDVTLQLGPGTLRHLTFQEWTQLETSEADRLEQQFGWAKPVFWILNGDLSWVPEGTTYRSLIEDFHRALVLTTGFPLTNPLVSMIYFDGGMRKLGPCRRQMVLTRRNYRVPLTKDSIDLFNDVFESVMECRKLNIPALEQIVDVLADLVQPITDAFNVVVHVTSRIEWILVPNRIPKITETFARRVGAAVATTSSELDHERSMARMLYSLRSDIVHGRKPQLQSQHVTLEEIWEYGVNALRRLGLTILLLSKDGYFNEQKPKFSEDLDEAWNARQPILDRLRADIQPLRKKVETHAASTPVKLTGTYALSRFEWEFARKFVLRSVDETLLPEGTKTQTIEDGIIDLDSLRESFPELWANIQEQGERMERLLDEPIQTNKPRT